MRFKLDENLPADLADHLREAGHDVADVVEEGLGGQDDPLVFNAAKKERRTLLTFDLDFADIRRYPPGTHHGIVVFRLEDQRWLSLRERVDRLLSVGSLGHLGGGLAIVNESRVRFKRPPRRAK